MEIFRYLQNKGKFLLELGNVPDLVNIPKCALAELVGDEELVEQDISNEFFAKEDLHLTIGLIVVITVGNLSSMNLVTRKIFLSQ